MLFELRSVQIIPFVESDRRQSHAVFFSARRGYYPAAGFADKWYGVAPQRVLSLYNQQHKWEQ